MPDGFVSNPDDCDDSSAEISPDGLEECDGVDNDCNGSVDDLPPVLKTHFCGVPGQRWRWPVCQHTILCL